MCIWYSNSVYLVICVYPSFFINDAVRCWNRPHLHWFQLKFHPSQLKSMFWTVGVLKWPEASGCEAAVLTVALKYQQQEPGDEAPCCMIDCTHGFMLIKGCFWNIFLVHCFLFFCCCSTCHTNVNISGNIFGMCVFLRNSTLAIHQGEMGGASYTSPWRL